MEKSSPDATLGITISGVVIIVAMFYTIFHTIASTPPPPDISIVHDWVKEHKLPDPVVACNKSNRSCIVSYGVEERRIIRVKCEGDRCQPVE